MAETLASLRRQRVPIEDAALAATVGLLVESQRPLEAWQLALRVAGRPQRLSRSAGSAATLSSLSSGGGGEGMPTGEGDAEEGMYPWYWCGGGAAGGMLLASSWRERVHPVYQVLLGRGATRCGLGVALTLVFTCLTGDGSNDH